MIRIKSNTKDLMREYTAKLESMKKGGQGYVTTMREIATTMRAEIGRRVHSEGKNSNDSDIGQYSKKPIYVNTDANVGRSFGRPIGKTGKSKFESGKKKGQDHKSRYFAGGYNEFKTAIGRNRLGKVNFSLSGQMSNQFSVVEVGDTFGVGWANTEMTDRALALDKKFSRDSFKVYALTEKEKELSNAIAEQQIFKLLNS